MSDEKLWERFDELSWKAFDKDSNLDPTGIQKAAILALVAESVDAERALLRECEAVLMDVEKQTRAPSWRGVPCSMEIGLRCEAVLSKLRSRATPARDDAGRG